MIYPIDHGSNITSAFNILFNLINVKILEIMMNVIAYVVVVVIVVLVKVIFMVIHGVETLSVRVPAPQIVIVIS